MFISEIIEKVIKTEDPPFRPSIPKALYDKNVIGIKSIMDNCLCERSHNRPSFAAIVKRLKETTGYSYLYRLHNDIVRQILIKYFYYK